MIRIGTLVFAVFSSLISVSASAALIEAGFPPPGGVNYASSGTSNGHSGGLTWHFTNFDNTAYDELYYSVKYLEMGESPGAGVVPLTYNASGSNLAGGIAVWTNTFQFFNAQSGQYETVDGSFTLTVTDALSNALALTDATSLGLDANLGGVLNVAGDFNANWLFEIDGTAAREWYDAASNHPSNSLRTSVGGSFYYTEPSEVPLPAAAWLFLSAVGGLGILKRVRK